MSGSDKGCLVCGAEQTVRSHIFPASLVKRIKRDAKHVIAGTRFEPGVKYSQSGLWRSDILCDAHERCLAAFDDYAARTSRSLDRLSKVANEETIDLPNPKPSLLTKFAVSILWRYAASMQRDGRDFGLGPYMERIASSISSNAPLQLEVLLGRSSIVDPLGQPTEMAIAPYKNKMLNCTVWQLIIGRIDYYVKADQRRFPSEWLPYTTASDPVRLVTLQPMPVHQIAEFAPIFQQMGRRANARP